ncbi:nitroreductase family protein [Marinicauda salina]|uniref:Nitroreductase family protein n=1 Tax=Marinicauda salina TaxID=2135793 RepID=A0A2U2BVC9_9PROT|nr:nitroreductase family protein [Marinicauda salina]PWE17947.1 nitroreductase family protein [Marinicauda salina]
MQTAWSGAATDTDLERANDFRATMARRRSVRDFSGEAVDRELIRCAIETAAQAPSGVNRQPWRFYAIGDAQARSMVRELACEQEAEDGGEAARAAFARNVAPVSPDPDKACFSDAPWLIAVFGALKDPQAVDPFFTRESLGIATGMLVTALHVAGVSSLVHAPVAEDYLAEVCGADEADRLFLLVLAGYPARATRQPAALTPRKSFHQVAEFIDGPAGDGTPLD